MKTKRFRIRESTITIKDDDSDLTPEEIEERNKWWKGWRSTGNNTNASGKATTKKHSNARSTNTSSYKIHDPTLVCSGITKKGLPCRNKTKNQTGYCHIH